MAKNNLIITTPRGTVFNVTNKDGKATAKVEWAPDFGSRFTGNYNQAQRFVDSEVLRCCASLVPFDTGMLQKSGTLGTVVGNGEVQYIAPYAAAQYYNTAQSRIYDSRRGGMWFERMKAAEGARILRGAAKLAGGGS